MTMRRLRGRRGAAAVEIAVLLPLLLIVLVGLIEVSLAIHESHAMTRAAREGCRIGASILEGPEPTGDAIRAAAEAGAITTLETAGFACDASTRCVVTARWESVQGWQAVRVEVSRRRERLLLPWSFVSRDAQGSFVMLTQQQKVDGA